jgi:hypothetical protein
MRKVQLSRNSRLSRLEFLAFQAGVSSVILTAAIAVCQLRAAWAPSPEGPSPVVSAQANSQPIPPPAPRSISEAAAELQKGTLTVWVPKTYVQGINKIIKEYEWDTLREEFKHDFPHFDLRFEVRERDAFIQAMRASAQGGEHPDVAYVDNMAQLRPLERSQAVLEMRGRSRFSDHGWWVVFRQAESLHAGKSFLLWLSQSPHWQPLKPATVSASPVDFSVVQALSREAIEHIANSRAEALASIMDLDAPPFENYDAYGSLALLGVTPLATLANPRLALVILAVVTERPDEFGMNHWGVVLRNRGDGWKVLLLLPHKSLPELEDLFKLLDRLQLAEEGAVALPKVTLLAPEDHARFALRPPDAFLGTMPPIRFALQWAPVDAKLAAYVIERQFVDHYQAGRGLWSPSSIELVSPIPSDPALLRSFSGPSSQASRWRIWAVGKAGAVSISDWRTIDPAY